VADPLCPIIIYEISSVINPRTNAAVDFSSFLSINATGGHLSVTDYSTVRQVLEIHVRASTSHPAMFWSDDSEYLATLEVTAIPPEIVLPPANFPPFFDNPLENQQFQLAADEVSFSYVLPSFSDPLGDSVTLDLDGLASFMTWDEATNTLLLSNATAGSTTVATILEDEYGMQTTSSFTVTVLQSEVAQASMDPLASSNDTESGNSTEEVSDAEAA